MAVSKNKKKDSILVSGQIDEIAYIASIFTNSFGEHPPAPLIYAMQHAASINSSRRVLREDFYKALEMLGYKKCI